MLLEMLDPVFALEIWNQSVSRTCQGKPRFSALTVVDAMNGPRWSVQYVPQLTPSDQAGPAVEILVAQYFPDAELQGALAKAQRRLQAVKGGNPGWNDWIVARPEGLLLYPFPFDPKIRRLSEAVEGEAAWQVFGEHPGLIPAGLETPEECRVEVLRYVPGKRCQLRYTFRQKDQVWQVLGKLFREGRGKTLFEDMQEVSAHYASNAPVGLTTPRPLAYLPDWNMVLQSHFAGTTLYELMHLGHAGDTHVAGAARSIAHLHSGRFLPRARHLVDDELALLSRSVAQLQEAGLANDRFEYVLEQTRRCTKHDCLEASVPVHRDFYDKQLLIGEDEIALIDLDTLALGPPEIDLANFLAHLQLRRLQGIPGCTRVHDWGRLFLEEYRRCSRSAADPGITRFFMAAAFLRLACKYRLKQNRTDLADRLLSLSQSVLETAPNRGLKELVL